MRRSVCIRAAWGVVSTLTIGVCLNRPAVAQTLSFSPGPQSAAPIRVHFGQDVPPVQGARVRLIQATDSVVDRIVKGAILDRPVAYQAPADTRWTAVRSLAGTEAPLHAGERPLAAAIAAAGTNFSHLLSQTGGNRITHRQGKTIALAAAVGFGVGYGLYYFKNRPLDSSDERAHAMGSGTLSAMMAGVIIWAVVAGP
jgi:hypothetical protein